jgi:hypothetical protein
VELIGGMDIDRQMECDRDGRRESKRRHMVRPHSVSRGGAGEDGVRPVSRDVRQAERARAARARPGAIPQRGHTACRASERHRRGTSGRTPFKEHYHSVFHNFHGNKIRNDIAEKQIQIQSQYYGNLEYD